MNFSKRPAYVDSKENVHLLALKEEVEPESIIVPSPLHYKNDPGNTVGARYANLVLNNMLLSSPQRGGVGTITMTPNFAEITWGHLATCGKYVFVGGTGSADSIYAIDEVLDSVIRIPMPSSQAWNVAIAHGKYLYVTTAARGTDAIVAIDTTTLAVQLISMPYTSQWGSMVSCGKYVYVAGGLSMSKRDYIAVIDTLTNTASSIVTPITEAWSGFAVSGNQVYVFTTQFSASSACLVIDTNTQSVSKIDYPSSVLVSSPVVCGDRICVGCNLQGALLVIDTKTNTAKTLALALGASATWRPVAVWQNCLIATSNAESNVVAFLMDGSDIVSFPRLPFSSIWTAAAVCNGNIYIGSSVSGNKIGVIDASDPGMAELNCSSLTMPGAREWKNFAVRGGHVYVTGATIAADMAKIDANTNAVSSLFAGDFMGGALFASGTYVYAPSPQDSSMINRVR